MQAYVILGGAGESEHRQGRRPDQRASGLCGEVHFDLTHDGFQGQRGAHRQVRAIGPGLTRTGQFVHGCRQIGTRAYPPGPAEKTPSSGSSASQEFNGGNFQQVDNSRRRLLDSPTGPKREAKWAVASTGTTREASVMGATLSSPKPKAAHEKIQSTALPANSGTAGSGFCRLATAIGYGMVRIDRPVNVNALRHRVHVPNHFSSRLGNNRPSACPPAEFRRRSVVIFATNLHGRTCGAAFDEAASDPSETAPCARKRPAQTTRGRKPSTGPRTPHYRETLRHRAVPRSHPGFDRAAARRTLPRLASRGHEDHDPSSDQFRLFGSAVEIVQRGSCRRSSCHAIAPRS